MIAGTLLHAATRTLATRHGDFTAHVCRDLTRRTYCLVIARGDLTTDAPLLARVHSSCVTSETYGGCDCDCAEQLDAALGAIAAAGRGAVFYLDQEGRGAGFVAKVLDRMLVQASRGALDTFEAYARMGLASDLRSYEAVAAARTLLGIRAPLTLLTNNPEKLAMLATLDVPLAGTVALALPPSPFNRHYLTAKAEAGHRLTATEGPEAEPPGDVAVVTPAALAEAPHLVRIGGYWLPIRLHPETTPHWFRLHAYADLAHGRERVVLTYGDPATTPVLVRWQREALLERIPGRARGTEQRRWTAAIDAFVTHGAGIAVMLADECGAAAIGAPHVDAGEERATTALVRHHLGGRAAAVLTDDDAADACRSDALVAAGVAATRRALAATQPALAATQPARATDPRARPAGA